MTQSNVEILQDLYASFAAGDVPAVVAAFADEMTWQIPGDSPIAGSFTGADEIVGLFGTLAEISGGTYRQDVTDMLFNDDDSVAVFVTGHAERKGRSASFDQIHVWKLAGGKTLSFRSFQDGDAENTFWKL
jgi:ketosteroid isomerase-like protein